MAHNVSVELVIASRPVCQSSVLVQHLIWVRTVISEHELFLVLALQWWMCVFLHDAFFLLKPPEQCPPAPAQKRSCPFVAVFSGMSKSGQQWLMWGDCHPG